MPPSLQSSKVQGGFGKEETRPSNSHKIENSASTHEAAHLKLHKNGEEDHVYATGKFDDKPGMAPEHSRIASTPSCSRNNFTGAGSLTAAAGWRHGSHREP
jgi:hypothetical protein